MILYLVKSCHNYCKTDSLRQFFILLFYGDFNEFFTFSDYFDERKTDDAFSQQQQQQQQQQHSFERWNENENENNLKEQRERRKKAKENKRKQKKEASIQPISLSRFPF